jgi:hypothetical protein
VRVRQLVVEAQGGVERRQRGVEVAVTVAGKRQLEAHVRRAIIQPEVLCVDLARQIKALLQIADVAELVERPGCRRIERHRGRQVSRSGFQLAATLVGLAASEVREHRIATQRDGAAVGLDRPERLVVAQGDVTPGEVVAIVACPRRQLVADRGRQADHG